MDIECIPKLIIDLDTLTICEGIISENTLEVFRKGSALSSLSLKNPIMEDDIQKTLIIISNMDLKKFKIITTYSLEWEQTKGTKEITCFST